MSIPAGEVDRVRQATDILAVARGYTSLRLVGRNHVGRCPIEPQTTPSFNVNAATQRFRCFECSAGGDAIELVCLTESIGFDDAVRLLGNRAGIILHDDEP